MTWDQVDIFNCPHEPVLRRGGFAVAAQMTSADERGWFDDKDKHLIVAALNEVLSHSRLAGDDRK
jgi:hypothetical protein